MMQKLKGQIYGFSRPNYQRAFLFILFFSFTFCLLNILGRYFETESAKEWIEGFGFWGISVFAVLYFASIVVPATAGLPLIILAIGIFGTEKAIGTTFIVLITGGAANFLTARFLGRKLLTRLLGGKNMERLDIISQKFGIKTLIAGRLFEGFLFEWISYVAGLSRMGFKTYMLVTMVFSIPYILLLYFMASNIDNLGQLYLDFTLINYIIMGVPLLYFPLNKLLKNSLNH